MIKLILLVALSLACAAQITPLNPVNLPAGKVNLIADNGQFLKVCQGCGGAWPDSASIQPGTGKQQPAIWTLQVVGSKVAFRGSNGLYLSRCINCWTNAAYISSAFVNSRSFSIYNLFTPELQANGKYAFKGDNDKYLARCESCVPNLFSKNFAFIHKGDSSKPWAQWTVTYTNLPPNGITTLRADNGDYLKLCDECGANNAVSVEPGFIGARNQLNIVRVGTKVALQASNGLWLSLCNNCWNLSIFPDSVFAHLPINRSPSSLWTVTLQPTGKWTFQGSNGKFLARCNNCTAAANVPDLAFAYSPTTDDPWSQWTLSNS